MNDKVATTTSARTKFEIYFPWIVCGVGALFYCYEYFLRVTPSVMQTQLMSSFNIDNALFGSLAAFYYYAYTPMQLPVGVLMDRYGPRKLLTLACLLCVIGTCFFGTNSYSVAAFGRFLVGMGSAFAFVGVLKLATIWLPPHRFAMVAGMVTAMGMFGPMLGDISLTPLVAKIGWHQTVFITAILGVILTVILWVFIRDKNTLPNHPEMKTSHRVENFKDLWTGLAHMLRIRQVWFSGLIAGCLFLPISIFAELWGIPYLEQAQHFPDMYAGFVNPLLFLGFAIGGTLFGWVSDSIGRRREPIMVGGILAFISACLLFYVPRLSFTEICILLFLLGLFAGVEVITFALSRESVAHRFAGTAVAMTNFLTMLGGMIFQPVIGTLLDFHATNIMKHSVTALTNSDYRFALTVVPICLAASAVLAFFVHEPRRHQ
ncbi:MAG: MFS transporter [Legionellales bacterium]|nr:MFS transporter [Legionellales bacterium]